MGICKKVGEIIALAAKKGNTPWAPTINTLACPKVSEDGICSDSNRKCPIKKLSDHTKQEIQFIKSIDITKV